MSGDARGAEVPPSYEMSSPVQIARMTSQRLLEQLGALIEVDAQRGELPLEVADTDREREPAPESRSRVAPDLATTNGFRYGSTTMFGISRSVVVRAAANPSATNGSSASCPPAASHRCGVPGDR